MSGTDTPAGGPHPLVAAVYAVAAGRADQPALAHADGVLTYGRLLDEVDRVAEALRAHGVAPGRVVAVWARRDRWFPVLLLAVWRVGAVAAVVDTTLPDGRVAACERVAAAGWRLRTDPHGRVEVAPLATCGPVFQGASHVLFTSGTTGRPAAVLVSAEAITAMLRWYAATLVPRDCRVGLLSGLGHDPVLRDVFAALLTGGTLVVPPDGTWGSPVRMASFVADARLNLLHGTPGMLELLLAGSAGPTGGPLRSATLETVVSGGAVLRWGLVRRLSELTGARIVNGYGATETPQLASYEVATSRPELTDPACGDHELVGVGSGAAGTELLLLPRDPGHVRGGEGDEGEVLVCGPHLATGYVGDSGRSERFLPDPYGRPGMRAFRTGDLGVRTADGGVRIVGRTDREVSVNGSRVALEEVEQLALAQAPVAQAYAALVRGPVDDYLTLEVVPAPGGTVEPTRLQRTLARHLPAAVVPRRVTVVESLPLGPNLKVTAPPVRHEVTERPLTEAPEDWDRLAAPREVDLGSSLAWNRAMSGVDDVAVTVRVARAAPSAGRAAEAVVPVFRHRHRPAHPGLDPAVLLLGGSAELDREPDAWAPVTLLGSVAGVVTSPAARDVGAWLTALFRPEPADTGAPGSPPASTVAVPYLSDAVAAAVRDHAPSATLLLTGARAVLDLPYRSREEYEAALPKRQREDRRRERRLLRRGGRTVGVEPLTPELIKEIAELQAMTQRRHRSHPASAEAFVDRYHRLASSSLAPSVVTFVCRHRGAAIAYTLGVVRDGLLCIYAAGMDYERTGSHAEYFNVLVHEPVDYCLRRGLRGVDLGMGGLRQKVLRGGALHLVWGLLVRAPRGWSEASSRRFNRVRAALAVRGYGRYLSATAVERLSRTAETGVADFHGVPRWSPGGPVAG